MPEIIQLIPSRIKNASVGGYLAGAVDIIDDSLRKNQQELNRDQQELNAMFNVIGNDFPNFAAVMIITLNYGYVTSTITSQEWKYAVLDNEDKVLAGVRIDNSVFIADILTVK